MGVDDPVGERGSTPRASSHPRTRRAAVAVAVAVALVVGLLGLVGAKLNGNITRFDIGSGAGPRPENSGGPDGPLNILVIGSDTREGIGTDEYGTDTVEGGAHSDTNLLVHIGADRKSAYVVSIPRDSMTMAPKDCSDPASTVADGEMRQWNYNFNQGGPACTVKTLEGVTGVYVDHVVVIDFAGFQSMVDGLGGVEVCLPDAVKDEDAQIDLPAGRQRLDGKDALGYVRARKSLGDGSDLGRIKRQQAFMSSMAQQATESSLLLRPDRLYSFLDAATRSMTADEDLSLNRMRQIAQSLRDFGISNLTFVTVPTEPYAKDPNRVVWKEKKAAALWDAVRTDSPLPGTQDKKEPETPEEPLTVSPREISVSVVNDTTAEGLAGQEVAALSVQGFTASVGSAAPTGEAEGVTVRHAPGRKDAARTVAAAYPGASLVQDKTLDDVVVVVLGKGAANAIEVDNRVGDEPVPSPSVSAPPKDGEIETRQATEDICG
ncbi:hypothetical protein GCM10022199_04720 [Marihabitans asiaticum]|uniref:LytR family transcriptional attenuator n=1 Tax=Marihabitans asiaticum TaxID=415218 RepID=A0A560WDW2_9MICO|nr:LCP family protein [Marihabitans asiaticum]TWD15857.1 LytR family transcriptional attenuator [Marihabitans asiaticum]